MTIYEYEQKCAKMTDKELKEEYARRLKCFKPVDKHIITTLDVVKWEIEKRHKRVSARLVSSREW